MRYLKLFLSESGSDARMSHGKPVTDSGQPETTPARAARSGGSASCLAVGLAETAAAKDSKTQPFREIG